MQQPTLAQIFIHFLRLGMTAFGGPAMVPYIRALAVDRKQWLGEESFRLGMAVTQVIPGATAMQMAAYVGLRSRGGPGALAAYAGFGLPAFLLMLVLTMLYVSTRDVPLLVAAFGGLQLVVVALVLHAAVNFSRRYLGSLGARLLACVAGAWFGLKGNPILALVVVCALSLFLLRKEGGNAFAGEGGRQPGRPLFAALVIALAFAVFLVLLALVMPEMATLGLVMAKIDCFAFGGGYVSLPIMLHEVVEARNWVTPAQFMDGLALGQVTPGPIVMTGAFVGYLLTGLAGAVVATISVFTPSLIFVCAVTPFADKLAASPLARRAFRGSLITLVGLMAAVAVRFGLDTSWGVPEVLLALGAFTALRLGTDILWVVLGGFLAGAILL
ncbi:chromate efflux transporter [Pseudodesulfovibrio cashew]|uniref:Chromate efflux transporter n=1 Tax=Pseudodesulfovibrio cashew TaxID=2678688 RepID=A0A6I6JFF7_9BACT|nr:chromate efflux transporter [Pseudodesulfovibrio cashew]QGY39748.1 chromate efflux transporter [Pseudodesulfovibrio cashew]